jgi:formate/nitrite transporter FocA (FNT family)
MLLSVASVMTRGLSGFAGRFSSLAQGRTMPCVAATWCVLGLVGSGFDHSIADVASIPDGTLASSADGLAWDGLINNALFGSLGIVAATVTVLALSLWIAPSAPVNVTHRQARSHDAAD